MRDVQEKLPRGSLPDSIMDVLSLKKEVWLQDSCTLEVHQSFGTDYHTVAAAQLKMRDIVDKTHGRLHGTAQLTGRI